MKVVRAVDGQVEIQEVSRPEGEGVRVRIRSVGICGSDLHMLESGYPMASIPGHEMAGETPDGTAVAVEPIAPCGQCDPCRRGAYNQCRDGSSIWIGTGRDGGMAEELLVPERCLVPLAPNISVTNACVIEPLAVALHGLRRASLCDGDRVAVVGGGTIGLCAVAACAATGVSAALDARHDHQREVGDRLGAQPLQEGNDVCFEASGTTEGLERAAALCRPGGRIVLLGTFWAGCEVPMMDLSLREIDLVPSSAYARAGAVRDIDVAASMLAQRAEIADALITHRFPLEAAPEAFQVARQRDRGAIKVVLEP